MKFPSDANEMETRWRVTVGIAVSRHIYSPSSVLKPHRLNLNHFPSSFLCRPSRFLSHPVKAWSNYKQLGGNHPLPSASASSFKVSAETLNTKASVSDETKKRNVSVSSHLLHQNPQSVWLEGLGIKPLIPDQWTTTPPYWAKHGCFYENTGNVW